MEYTIEPFQPFSYLDEGKLITLNGYAFMDKNGHCIIIAYGEGRRDALIEHFKGDTNELGLKYNYIDNVVEYEYIVEKRRFLDDSIFIENPNCFVSKNLDDTKNWIRKNINTYDRSYLWWWVIIKHLVDGKKLGEMIKSFDWDGIEHRSQPKI